MRNDALLRSTSVRLSLLYAALIVASFACVGILIWFLARDTAERELRQDIALEVTAIRTELEAEGLDAAIAAIRARAEQPGAFDYWVADFDGRRLAGDDPALDGPDGWHHARIHGHEDKPEVGRHEELLVFTETLAGGVRLSVGDDVARARAVQNTVLKTLASVGGIAVLICLVIGVLITRRVLARMERLTGTLEQVAGGNIAARFPSATSTGSDIDQIGDEVNKMLDRIERLVRDVRRVSRDVAHDLRTPLTHLQQRLEQASAAATAESRIEAIEGAQQKAGELLRIFDAIVRLSEIEAGMAKQRFKPVDLATIVENVADAYRPDIEESAHELAFVQLEPCRVVGDEDLLAQAAANLLENAMHHTPPGTRIELRVGHMDGHIGFEVCDNGPGIPAGSAERLLEPFMRLDQSRTTPGSGLGLSLVAAIARLHDAELVITDAEPGLRVSLRFDTQDGPSGSRLT